MISYPKSCCGSIETLPESQFLLLLVNSCIQTIHVPVVPFQYYSRHVAGNSSRKLETSFLHHLYVLISKILLLRLNSDVHTPKFVVKIVQNRSNPAKIRYNTNIRCNFIRISRFYFSKTTQGVSRSVSALQVSYRLRISCFTCCQSYLNPKSPAKIAKIAKMSTLRLNIFKTAAPIQIRFCLHSYICLSYLNPSFQAKIPIFKKLPFFPNKPYCYNC